MSTIIVPSQINQWSTGLQFRNEHPMLTIHEQIIEILRACHASSSHNENSPRIYEYTRNSDNAQMIALEFDAVQTVMLKSLIRDDTTSWDDIYNSYKVEHGAFMDSIRSKLLTLGINDTVDQSTVYRTVTALINLELFEQRRIGPRSKIPLQALQLLTSLLHVMNEQNVIKDSTHPISGVEAFLRGLSETEYTDINPDDYDRTIEFSDKPEIVVFQNLAQTSSNTLIGFDVSIDKIDLSGILRQIRYSGNDPFGDGYLDLLVFHDDSGTHTIVRLDVDGAFNTRGRLRSLILAQNAVLTTDNFIWSL